METFTSFVDLKKFVMEQESARIAKERKIDMEKAANLRRSRPIAKKAVGTGPRIAR